MNEDELKAAIREAIWRGIAPEIQERAIAYWDSIEDLLAVLEEVAPEILKELGMGDDRQQPEEEKCTLS